VLQGRLIGLAVAAGLAAVATGCGDGSDGAIADNVIEPGITAINNAELLTCDQNLAALQTAIQAYAMLEGAPPADEAALVEAAYLRGEVEGWDVVNGQTVATDAQCGDVGATPANTAVPATAPATTIGQIVTDTEAPMTAEQMLATLTDEQIVAMGGTECANELVAIAVAAQRFVEEQGVDPLDMAALIDAGYLTAAPVLWTVVDGDLVGIEGSGCVDPAGTSDPAQTCVAEATTLEVAREAYFAANPEASLEPTVDDLVAEGLLRAATEGVYLVDGVVVPTLDGPCVGVDLSP
jgi:hypothetical protein